MALHIVNVNVEVFVAVFVGNLLYLEHWVELLEAVVNDILLPYVVVDAALPVLVSFYAVVAGSRLVNIDGGVCKEEELAL